MYSLRLTLSHVLNVLSSLNYVSVSPVTVSLFLHLLLFFSSSTFNSFVPVQKWSKYSLCFGDYWILFLTLPSHLFCWSNLTSLLGLLWYVLSVFMQLLRYISVWCLADTILFLCLSSLLKQKGIFECPRSCGCYLYRADVALFLSLGW